MLSNSCKIEVFYYIRCSLIEHLSMSENYDVLVDWHQLHPQLKKTNNLHAPNTKENYDDESEGIQSKQRWMYVKVNMDGVLVGRKICILDHMDYFSLALQLEDMFGMYVRKPHETLDLNCSFTKLMRDYVHLIRKTINVWFEVVPS